jgi:exosortase A
MSAVARARRGVGPRAGAGAPPAVAGGSSEVRVAWLAWLAIVAAAFVGFAESWSGMVRVWLDADKFQHGLAIAPIAAWAAWRIRGRLDGRVPVPSVAGLVAAIACCAVWALGALAGVATVMQAAAVALIGASAWAVAGGPVARAMAFPLGFLLFMVPAGEALSGPLMQATADVLEAALRLAGVPVERSAFEFRLPTGTWSVIEACGGLNYLVAALPLATLCAWLRFVGVARRLGFIAAALLAAVLANWVRAVLLVGVGHLSAMRWGTGDEHLVWGWVLFGVLMAGIAATAVRLGDAGDWPTGAAGRFPWPGVARPAAVEAADRARRPSSARGGTPGVAAVLAVAIAVAGYAGQASGRVAPRDGFEPLLAGALGGPSQPSQMAPMPRYTGERARFARRLDEAAGLDVWTAYFAGQQQGRELVGWPNTVLARDDRRWKIHAESVRQLGAIRIVEWQVHGEGRHRLVWHWQVAVGAPRSGPVAVKLAALLGTIAGRGDHAAIAVLSADLDGADPERLRERMAEWALRLGSALDTFTGGSATDR